MPRRRKEKGHENLERWLLTYADLITLLMIFFVIMYAMSQINQTKFISLEKSLSEALHNSSQIPVSNGSSMSMLKGAGSSKQQNNGGQTTKSQPDQLDKLEAQVKSYIQQHHLEGFMAVDDQKRGVQITLRDVVLFDTGQADLRPNAVQILNGLTPFLKEIDNPVVIEGYTDSQPINTVEFPSNWELSAARAIHVVRYLVSQGIDPTRLSGVGYGQYNNLYNNDTAAHMQMNRKVNIVILRQNPLSPSQLAPVNSTGG